MNQGNGLPARVQSLIRIGMLLLLPGLVWAQQPDSPADAKQDVTVAAAIHDLQVQVKELREAVAEVRAEAAQYRSETAELKRELQNARNQLATTSPAEAGAVTPGVPAEKAAAPKPLEDRVAALEDSSTLLSAKVDDQYQTKVENASKYRVRLSGIALINLFSNRGSPDNADYPNYVPQPTALDPKGSFGATMRQSELGLEVFGPRLAGARTSGNVQVDFAGGSANTLNGVNFGLVRLRIASMRMDWEHTSVVVGQDSAFFSPLSPTSFASLAVPAFGYAGNLWAWTPQVRVEHRFDLPNDQQFTLQGGILDNLAGEPPYQFDRLPQAGERSGQPAYAVRTAWSRHAFSQPMSLAVAGYYSRQDWGFNRHIDGWAGMADWEIPLAPRFSLTGEFYRGKAVGGIGGGVARSVLFSGDPTAPYTQIRPIQSIGGWTQVKFRATPKLEFNVAAGMDNPFAQDIRAFPNGLSYVDPTVVQNRGALVNFVYRPRSNLLFSSEFRRLRTFNIDDGSQAAQQVNLMMGILF